MAGRKVEIKRSAAKELEKGRSWIGVGSRSESETLATIRRVRFAAGLRHTAVEIAGETAPWSPPAEPSVLVRVAFEEQDLHRGLKAAGAPWEAGLRRWRVLARLARELDIKNHLDLTSNHR